MEPILCSKKILKTPKLKYQIQNYREDIFVPESYNFHKFSVDLEKEKKHSIIKKLQQ